MSVENGSSEKAAGLAPKPSTAIGTRHIQIFISFIGLVVAYMQRVNLSEGIVAMTDETTNSNFPTVDYTFEEQTILSSMFFYGYMVAGVPAGLLANKFSPVKLVSIIGGICSGLLTVIFPFAAVHIGFWSVCALRVMEGLCQSLFYPCTQAIVSQWVVPQEIGSISWIWSAPQLATIIMSIAGGSLSEGVGGWPSIFYISGIIGIVWGVMSLIFGADSPSTHRSITEKEKNYIESHLVENSLKSKKKSIPWCSILTSVPFYALLCVYFGACWGFFSLLTLLPSYIHGVFGFDMEKNGLLTSVPYLGAFIGGFICSFVGSVMVGKFSTNFIRKASNSFALYGGGLALLVLAFFHTNATWAIVLLTVSSTVYAGINNGHLVNILDMAPNFVGIIMGMANAFGNIASIVAPQLAGVIVDDETNEGQWQIVFLISAAMFIAGNTIFVCLGSTETQPWNTLENSQQEGEIKKNPDNVDVPV